eukprot:TRINITY_DN5999_c0_g2_i1.p1 TRINITY_DN5999_c0_g2~~TRINITY_DN5999_c0_g2_i1.p1  ORF type:complete len:136 (-),score=5.55 TRINITY_DN5999_c0_g2_i1:25-432(-)
MDQDKYHYCIAGCYDCMGDSCNGICCCGPYVACCGKTPKKFPVCCGCNIKGDRPLVECSGPQTCLLWIIIFPLCCICSHITSCCIPGKCNVGTFSCPNGGTCCRGTKPPDSSNDWNDGEWKIYGEMIYCCESDHE